ncbi:hypothetical protein ATY81_06100 [Rhizobium sp. R72]|uniref:hypothetical protein n=1 Tax=unclassified Rhizobium TaxID=2613769 RepID=UPI000B52D5D4|nr:MULTISPECIES: hypothetical protein [unclassified Rhizobium]OWW00820.1 hypothetical protein ATY81_06100 [Rhizobium sp. R72]OWW01199.1 hypothetical protein ATY80_06100 [Rhizobium sp. R711]
MSGILIATLLATVSTKATAGFSTGELLFADCYGSRQFVMGYVTGWLDKWNRDEYLARRNIADSIQSSKALVNSAFLANSFGVNFCVPAGTKPEVIGDMLCTFLQQNPGVRDATGDDLMTTLIRGNYSCPVN